MNIKEKVIEVCKLLDELEEFDNSISFEMQKYDYIRCDFYHLIENMKLDSKKCYRVCRDFQKVLQERRKFKNQVELNRVFKDNKNKLISNKDNRNILLTNIGKTEKRLNTQYKNRYYTDEQIKEMLGE